MRQIIYWTLGTLIAAGILHIVTILYTPSFIMSRAMAGIAEQAGGRNMILYPPRVTAEARGIVRPSPDLLYAACAYDVSGGPVKLTASVPDTYWSLSLFADNTDNYFALNDKQANAKSVSLVVARSQVAGGTIGGIPVIVSPTDRGIALLRSLVDDERKFDAVDRARREATCEAMPAANP